MNSARLEVRMPTAPKMASPTSEMTQQDSSRWRERMRMTSPIVSGSWSSDLERGLGSVWGLGCLKEKRRSDGATERRREGLRLPIADCRLPIGMELRDFR